MQPVTEQYWWPSNMHSLLKYIIQTWLHWRQRNSPVTHAYWFVLTQLCSTHHITLQSSVRYVSSTFVRIQHTVHSAKLISCYSTNGIMEVKTSHFKNCFDCQTGCPSPMHARQQWSFTATHKYFLLQMCSSYLFRIFWARGKPFFRPYRMQWLRVTYMQCEEVWKQCTHMSTTGVASFNNTQSTQKMGLVLSLCCTVMFPNSSQHSLLSR